MYKEKNDLKFAAGITLYNPKNEYIDKILEYAKLFSYVFVQDNSEDNREYVNRFQHISNVLYFYSGENIGLPRAFNMFLELCIQKNIDYLCTLDQDTVLFPDAVRLIEQYIQKNNNDTRAVVALTPKDRVDGMPSDVRELNLKKAAWVICSGSFLNLQVLRSHNILYDENYFIDRFDGDFCKQIIRAGLEIIRIENLFMVHECGQQGRHSLLRHYYMFRNRRYFNDKYYNRIVSMSRTFLQDIRHVILLSCEVSLRKAIKIYGLAVDDYKGNRMGKVSEDVRQKICNEVEA